MANDFFNETGDPAANSRGRSSPIRTLFTLVGDAFDKLAGLSGNGGKLLRVNSGATAYEAMAHGAANTVLGENAAGNGYEHKAVSGTANQVTVTHGVGTITLATPQDLGTSSNVTFGRVTTADAQITGGAISGITDLAVTDGGTGASSAADARTNLGLVIGTNVQAYNADLQALSGLGSAGLVSRTGSGTAAARTLTAPAAGITVSNGDGVSGNPTLALANDLAGLEGLSGTGVSVRTGDGTWTTRTLTAGSGCVITNGDGVSGNPTIAINPGVGLGDVLGPASSTDGQITLFDGTTGKAIKASTLTGLLKATSGVPAAVVSGTDIKTVGGASLLGSGDVGAIGAAYGGTGVANNAANTITFSGNYGLTLTLSNTTSVSLPTSGTLATLAGTETLSGKTITALKETKTAPTISTNVVTIDCSAGNMFAVALNAAINSFTVSNIPSAGTMYAFVLEFTADGTPRTATWTFQGVAVKWAGGTAPTLTSTNGKKDSFVFYTWDAGTTWIGAVIGQNY